MDESCSRRRSCTLPHLRWFRTAVGLCGTSRCRVRPSQAPSPPGLGGSPCRLPLLHGRPCDHIDRHQIAATSASSNMATPASFACENSPNAPAAARSRCVARLSLRPSSLTLDRVPPHGGTRQGGARRLPTCFGVGFVRDIFVDEKKLVECECM